MIEYTSKERIALCRDELDDLVVEYYAKTIARKRVPPLDMDWNLYRRLQEEGNVLLVTARHVGDLVGFVTYIISHTPHHKTLLYAQSDILATKLNRRGQGIGRKLVRCGEDLLKDQGVHTVIHLFRTAYDVEPLFPKIGYTLEEQVYMKVL